MASGLNEIEAGVDTIINNFLPVNAVFLFKVFIKAGFNVLQDGFPASGVSITANLTRQSHLSSLSTKSPKPGVSTTVKRRRTPFSSMSSVLRKHALYNIDSVGYSPAVMLSMATVLGRSALGGRGSFGG